MAVTESPSLYIDFSRMPPPKVVEEIDYEALLLTYKNRIQTANPALAAALALEQSPLNLILETQAYGDMLLRARVNAAARANMLAFATGSDLDNLAAFFSQNQSFAVARIALVASPRNVDEHPEDWESDASFRRRIQLSPEAFACAGSEGGYIFHALTAAPSLRDVSVVRVNDRGLLRVTLLNSGSDPVPTDAQIAAVTDRLNQAAIKPLTDSVHVAPAEVIAAPVRGSVTLYPGPDANLVVADIQTALTRLRDRLSLLGRDLTRAALVAACSQEGVENVTITAPAGDIIVSPTQSVMITAVELAINPLRTE